MKRDYAYKLLEKVIQDYNLIADDFSRTRSFEWEELKFLFDNYLKRGEKVLDLGCGNGRWFKFFKEKGVEYFGIDSSERLIEIAKKLNPEGNFKVENALDLSFSSNFFDKVFSIAVFHHIPSKELRLKFLEQIKRVLKPNGYFIFTVWKITEIRKKILFFKFLILKILGLSDLDYRDIFIPWNKKTKRYYHCFSLRELKSLLKKVGFEIEKMGIAESKDKKRKNFFVICKKI